MEIKHDLNAMEDASKIIETIKEEILTNISEWDSIINTLGECWQDAAYNALVELNAEFKKEQNLMVEMIENFGRYILESARSISETVTDSTNRLRNNL